jgi:hypothetical protein
LKNKDGAERYGMLSKLRERETRLASSLATKLRLRKQSRYTPSTDALTRVRRVSAWPNATFDRPPTRAPTHRNG